MNKKQINSNGFISFKRKFLSPYPLSFPIRDTGLLSKIGIIAPFWADTEGRKDSNSVVYYSIYQQDDPYFSQSSELTTQVINMVKHDIKTTVSNQGEFIPSLVVVITWENMIRWPYEENYPKQEFNTFQLVLTTDQRSYRSYVIFIYGNNTYSQPFPEYSIGYQAPPVSDKQYGFFNHWASGNGKGDETKIDAFNLKNTYGNTSKHFFRLDLKSLNFKISADLAGKFIYKVSDTNCEEERSEYRCRKFAAEALFYEDELKRADSLLPKCPCHGYIFFKY